MSQKAYGIPDKVFSEAKGHIITVALTTNDIFKGVLVQSEGDMSLHMQDVTATFPNGKTVQMQNVYLSGCMIRLLHFPEVPLRNESLFIQKPVRDGKGKDDGFDKIQDIQGVAAETANLRIKETLKRRSPYYAKYTSGSEKTVPAKKGKWNSMHINKKATMSSVKETKSLEKANVFENEGASGSREFEPNEDDERNDQSIGGSPGNEERVADLTKLREYVESFGRGLENVVYTE